MSGFQRLPAWKYAALCAGIEAIALVSSPNSIYREGVLPAVAAVSFVAWFWLTLAFAAKLVVRQLRQLEEHHPVFGRVIRCAVAAGGILWGMQYAISWSLYLKTGQFATLAAFEFAIRNPPQTTWLYLGPGERLAVVIAACLGIVLWPALAWFLRRAGGKSHTQSQIPAPNSRMRWGLLTVCMTLSLWLIHKDPSDTRRHMRQSALKSCVNPQFTMMATIADRVLAAPIPANLDSHELTPIVQWQPPRTDVRPPSVIFIAVEALRSDVVHQTHQGREITPHLNRLAHAGIEWTRAYSQSTHSDYADVCIVSSLYPLRTREHHYYQRHDPWPRTLAFDVFKAAGYRTAIISSQNESWGGMDRFLETPGLDLFYDAERSGAETYLPKKDIGFWQEKELGTFSAGCLYDWHTMDTAISWVTEQTESGKPYFLSMNFQSSHFPYELPAGADQPFQPCEITEEISFASYPREKAPIVRNAYYNGLHYCDLQLGRMLATLEALGTLNDVVLVVMGENGEAFHENGSVGHAQAPVEPAIHVAAVMHAPNLLPARQEDYPMELIDLLPTTLGLLSWPPHPNFQGTDVLAQDRPDPDQRLLFFHVNSPLAHGDAVLLAGRWKYFFNRRTQQGTLHDIHVDPGESHNLASDQQQLTASMHDVLKLWRERQLAYYHYPLYYQSFYPPRAPVWAGLNPSEIADHPDVRNPAPAGH